MHAIPADLRLPLPKGWPNHIRFAVIHVISLAHFSLTFARSVAANSINARIRLKADVNRLRQEIAFWMHRLDEEGPHVLVQIRDPVNRFPEFVRYIVRRLKVLCPSMGKVKIAQVLCRAGLHLSSATVGRMLKEPLRPKPKIEQEATARVVTAKRPNHVWHVDLSTVPVSSGFWTAWLPWALPQRWPFCWWIAVAVDHFSRRVMGFAVFHKQPTSVAVRTFLGRVISKVGVSPRYFITDQGKQFRDRAFGRWCRRKGIRQRFDAVGKYGSLAVIERLIRTIKDECTRRVLVPYRRGRFRRELSLFIAWYNGDRPHTWLDGRTPDELYFGNPAACCAPRFEPRRRWPRASPCDAPQTRIRARRGVRLELNVNYVSGRRHLPIIELQQAA